MENSPMKAIKSPSTTFQKILKKVMGKPSRPGDLSSQRSQNALLTSSKEKGLSKEEASGGEIDLNWILAINNLS